MSVPMAAQRPSTVRRAALRSIALSLAKAFSIGLGVRWVQEAGTCGLDGVAHAGALVAGKIVHHHDVTRPQFGHQHLIDIGLESHAVSGHPAPSGRPCRKA